MYEITYTDKEKLQEYIERKKVCPNAIYDFTFENRFIIYHELREDECVYIVFDMRDEQSSLAYRNKKPLKLIDNRDFLPHIYRAIRYTGDRRYANNMFVDPIEIIDSIFRKVLPNYGFNVREEQIELSKRIFRGFTSFNISFCEAEVGTGKTLAYLIAGVVFRKYRDLCEPITISTATIELQNTLVEKEITRLSQMLMDYNLISRPLTAVVRKGKEHFFCYFRYKDLVDKLKRNEHKNQKLLTYFEETEFATKAFDLDKIRIPGSLKKKICIQGICGKCKYSDSCRYYGYVRKEAKRTDIDFQVTNHNMYLESEKLAQLQKGHILLPSEYTIIDEAHKLKETAIDIYGERICEGDVPKYINMVKTLCCYKNESGEFKQDITRALRINKKIFSMLKQIIQKDDHDDEGGTIFKIPNELRLLISDLKSTLERIENSRKKVESAHGIQGKFIIHTLKVFAKSVKLLTWINSDENERLTLCCCPQNIGQAMYEKLWRCSHHHVLMSGTMSDGTCFDYFEKENGLVRIKKDKKQYSSTPSPFDYRKNTRLYIPHDLPFPTNANDENYVSAIAERIVTLIKSTNGHTAILFTSYKMLNAVYKIAKDKLAEYELICMTRNNKTAIGDFKRKDNAILFASGTMWEGVDCVGDKLSSVIIVRLPFPMRSATLEGKKSASKNVAAFINEYAVPEMLIRLRQGVGRLIRSENDTGLISILDTRATHSAYATRVQSVLSKHPRVNSIEEINAYFREIKPKEYFEN